MEQDKLKEQGERLRQFRKKKGLKMREIADKIEIDVSSIGRWETGKQAIPVARLKNICAEYGLSRTWLETGEGEMFDEPKTFKDQMKAMYESLTDSYKEIWIECAAEIVKAGADTKNGSENAIKKLYELLKTKYDKKRNGDVNVNASITGNHNTQDIHVK